MKRLIALIALILVAFAGDVFAQVPCTIPCWKQSFPYVFCNPSTGVEKEASSTDPNDDSTGVSVKSFIPSCVTINGDSTIDTLWMPTSPVPNAPTPPDPVDTLGVFEYCYDEIDATGEVRDSMIAAWQADTSYVYNGESIQSHHLNADDYPSYDIYSAAQGVHSCDSEAYYSFEGQVAEYTML